MTFFFIGQLQAAVTYESNLSGTHSFLMDKDNTVKVFDKNNDLIFSKKIEAENILFKGIDNDSRYFIVQSQDKYHIYDFKKNHFKTYPSHLKEPITTFTVQTEKNLLVGTESGRVVKANIKSNGFKVFDYLVAPKRMPVKEIKFSLHKERFYVLHQKFNYNQIGFKFSNYLISDQQALTPSIGFIAQDSSPSGWNKTSVGFRNSHPVGDLELINAQVKNAKMKSQTYTQQLTVYNRVGKSYQKILAAEEISSFAFDKRMKNLYGSFKIENKVYSYNLMEILRGKGQEAVKEVADTHYNFLKIQNGKILLANADENIVRILDEKTALKITDLKFQSNIRAIHQVDEAFYVIEESGKVHLGSLDKGNLKIQKFIDVKTNLARDIQIKIHKNHAIITDVNGKRLKVFLPKNCNGIFIN
jgi:hypothetical protein